MNRNYTNVIFYRGFQLNWTINQW